MARSTSSNRSASSAPWWASALLLLIPVAFFGLLEGGLRVAGYGQAYPLFVEVPSQPEYLYQNRDVGRRYFTQVASVPNSQNDFFRKEKADSTLRIVVQGGSSAAGYPFYRGGSFSRMLEQRLLQTFPGRPVEVINTAMAAVNSYTLRDLVPEILAIEPDAVLIYAGHNEYYGALGVGAAESLGRFRPVVNLYLQLQDWRTVQLLRAGLSRLAGLVAGRDAGERPDATLMARMVGEQAIPYESPLYELGLRQFEGNMADVLAAYRESGVPVFIGTLASNERDHVPFVSGLAPVTDADAWDAAYGDARRRAAGGDTTGALAQLDALIQEDSLSAKAFYLKAQFLDGQGRDVEARVAYLAAKDRDLLRFRAPEAMNTILRELADEYGATVVETQAALAAVAPDGIIGETLMLEHLHPNLDGYFRIADAFYETLRTSTDGTPPFGAWGEAVPASVARQELLVSPIDSLLGAYRVRQLMNAWPFQPPGVVKQDTIQAANPVEALALDVLYDRATWSESMLKLQRYYETRGDDTAALRTILGLVQEFPFAPAPYLAAGNLYVRRGQAAEALPYFEAANDVEPSAPAQRMIGSILLQQGQRAEAIRWLEGALALDVQDVAALYNLAGAYALEGRYADARRTARRVLELRPDHADARRLLSSLPGGSN